MTTRDDVPGPGAPGPRIGFWGLLGSGNFGNDGSLDAVVIHLREQYPDLTLGFLCSDPDVLAERYGADATRMHWNKTEYMSARSPLTLVRKVIGKGVDVFRTAAWVSRYDLVIVPGMGVFEADERPMRAWHTPYSVMLLSVAGRLVGTPVALVSVGADVPSRRFVRLFHTAAMKLARYVSYRDEPSRDAAQALGVDTSEQRVYPDLVFALPNPTGTDQVAGTVGVGVMAYDGRDADRHRATEIAQDYVDALTRFVRWLLDNDYKVRLFIGDRDDVSVVDEIRSALGQDGSSLAAGLVTAEPMTSLQDLMCQMSAVDTVVATRFHNVLCGLKLAKPTISVSYAGKNDVLMSSVGLGDFCQFAGSLDSELLIKQFSALQERRAEIQSTLAEHSEANARLVREQLTELTSKVVPGHATRRRARIGQSG